MAQSKDEIKKGKSRFITCILPKGTGKELIRKLKDEKDITTANISNARGSGMASPQGTKGVGQQIEKDIVTVVIPYKQGEEIFNYIFDAANIDRPHGGFIYMAKLDYSVAYELPDLPMEP